MYKEMQTYYRNVGLWLTTPAQRRSMLVAAAWGVVASDPMAFPVSADRDAWAVGERVVAVIGRTASVQTLADLVGAFFPRANELLRPEEEPSSAEPSSSALPWDLTLRAVVGGIATSLLEPASDYHAAQRHKRRILDPDAIIRRGAEGAEQGHAYLIAALRSASASAAELADQLEREFQPASPESIPVSIDLVHVRVV